MTIEANLSDTAWCFVCFGDVFFAHLLPSCLHWAPIRHTRERKESFHGHFTESDSSFRSKMAMNRKLCYLEISTDSSAKANNRSWIYNENTHFNWYTVYLVSVCMCVRVSYCLLFCCDDSTRSSIPYAHYCSVIADGDDASSGLIKVWKIYQAPAMYDQFLSKSKSLNETAEQ